jgi:hypothetical protein
MSGVVELMPRFMRARKSQKPAHVSGFDAQLECFAGCLEELNILESKMGPGARRQTLEWIQDRYAREDREIAERAQNIE